MSTPTLPAIGKQLGKHKNKNFSHLFKKNERKSTTKNKCKKGSFIRS
jgi:hypothetical protein